MTVVPALPSSLWRLTCAAAAAAPFLSLYVIHYVNTDGPTGFLQYDQPYYSANGREVFERGNGLLSPNPYDPDPRAPAIYFHWLPWLLGFGIKMLGFDPGLQYVGLGIVAALLCSWITFRLVEAVLPDRRYLTLLFFLAMWGGGALSLGAAVEMYYIEEPITLNGLLRRDPALGWWALSWGRNLIYTSEAIYHAIIAGVWLAIVRGRSLLGIAGAALLAATHPFSGFQIQLILIVWFSIQLGLQPSRSAAARWMATAALLTAFLFYYFRFLPSFEQHRELVNVWSLPWNLQTTTMLLAYGPVALFAGKRLWVDRGRLDRNTLFFATCFVVSLLLAKHDWFVRPRQPLHFTRGYVWLPLFLLALPILQRLLIKLRERTTTASFRALLILLLTVAVLDNGVFLLFQTKGRLGLQLSSEQREMLAWMDERSLDGVLLAPHERFSYLAATYTSARPYLGHEFNTPDHSMRSERVQAWWEGRGAGSWLASIDYIVVPSAHPPSLIDAGEWQACHKNDMLVLFIRRVPRGPTVRCDSQL